jgi:hypothetical protein
VRYRLGAKLKAPRPQNIKPDLASRKWTNLSGLHAL